MTCSEMTDSNLAEIPYRSSGEKGKNKRCALNHKGERSAPSLLCGRGQAQAHWEGGRGAEGTRAERGLERETTWHLPANDSSIKTQGSRPTGQGARDRGERQPRFLEFHAQNPTARERRAFPSEEGALTPDTGTHEGGVPGARLPTSF